VLIALLLLWLLSTLLFLWLLGAPVLLRLLGALGWLVALLRLLLLDAALLLWSLLLLLLLLLLWRLIALLRCLLSVLLLRLLSALLGLPPTLFLVFVFVVLRISRCDRSGKQNDSCAGYSRDSHRTPDGNMNTGTWSATHGPRILNPRYALWFMPCILGSMPMNRAAPRGAV